MIPLPSPVPKRGHSHSTIKESSLYPCGILSRPFFSTSSLRNFTRFLSTSSASSRQPSSAAIRIGATGIDFSSNSMFGMIFLLSSMLIIDSIICKKWGHVSFTFTDLFFIFITFALNVVKEFIDFYLKNYPDVRMK